MEHFLLKYNSKCLNIKEEIIKIKVYITLKNKGILAVSPSLIEKKSLPGGILFKILFFLA